jgi:hypothetical protein
MYFYFKDKFEREAIRFDGIAGGLQEWVEELTAEWVSNIMKELNADQLVFSGGLSMNVKINKVLADHGVNIVGQYLITNNQIGYVITDINKGYNPDIIKDLRSIEHTIKFRVLY